jgi:hypothetical protein
MTSIITPEQLQCKEGEPNHVEDTLPVVGVGIVVDPPCSGESEVRSMQPQLELEADDEQEPKKLPDIVEAKIPGLGKITDEECASLPPETRFALALRVPSLVQMISGNEFRTTEELMSAVAEVGRVDLPVRVVERSETIKKILALLMRPLPKIKYHSNVNEHIARLELVEDVGEEYLRTKIICARQKIEEAKRA